LPELQGEERIDKPYLWKNSLQSECTIPANDAYLQLELFVCIYVPRVGSSQLLVC
jgi:hypothetical protein